MLCFKLRRLPSIGSSYSGASKNWAIDSLLHQSRRWIANSGGRRWTSEEYAAVRNLRSEGKTAKEIAPLLGRSIASIWQCSTCRASRRRLWSEEDLRKLHALVAQAMSTEAIADALGRSEQSIARAIHKYRVAAPEAQDSHRLFVRPRAKRKPWSQYELRKLRELLRTGTSVEEVAEALSRSVMSVVGRSRTDSGQNAVRFGLEEDQKLLEMRAAGMKWKQIHNRMPHRTMPALIQRYARLMAGTEALRDGERWSREDLEEVRRLKAEGLPRREIALRLKRSRQAISRVCDQYWKQKQ
ncbi:hypothetical protein CERZMDRAFT_91027 [Cercospora zeae-maydis SCOH1-5]|uniref:Transposase IS30-like HTH domain-containing protein n=1 Tax=Cercospora zeae-maydis SCOH1-5 TaxID=717836 RepID=A0A6A6FC64_9PEZI|nr:hypothetical protein CERZMDRAFT_91027 [Cercospora zeae-maydis SCOH1-5]